jgi:hypothetical protein
MISPIHSIQPAGVHQNSGHEISPPAGEPRPDRHAQAAPVARSGEVSQDQVTLKNAGQVDHDGDRT